MSEYVNVPGCGRCSWVGLIEVAWHFTDRHGAPQVETRSLHCDCTRGTYWADQRACVKEGDPSRPRGLQAAEWREERHRMAHTLAVYINPSPGQKRVDGREPELETATEAQLATYLREIGKPLPKASDRYEDDRW